MGRCGPHNLAIRTLTVGLLGGSFNPAHAGHVHVSREAADRLHLDEIWWLVSPQNPLKPTAGMADYTTRLRHARQVARAFPRIRVQDFEARLGLRYTVDSLRFLRKNLPTIRFVWLMGADNLNGFHRWKSWRAITRLVPIAVFDRAPFSHRSLRSKTALALAKYRLDAREATLLAQAPLPAWSYVHMRRHPASATDLRKKLGKNAFLGHNRQ